MLYLSRLRNFPSMVMVMTIGLSGAYFAAAQGNSERNQKWKPGEGKYYFSQAWVWSYVDEFSNSQGEMTIYIDTLSGTFLFNHETYGMSDALADFIIATQDGVYITGITDDNGEKSVVTDTLEAIQSSHSARQSYDDEFKRITRPTGEFKVYGLNSRKSQTIKGQKFRTTFDTPGAFSDDYLAVQRFSLLPVYYFNQRQASARLPYNFSGALHMNYLLLETLYESDGKRISLILKNVIPSKQVVDLALYRK